MSLSPHETDDWWPQPIPENVEMGERSYLYSSYAFVHYRSQARIGVSIGNDSGVYDGTSFELGPAGSVAIGDFCTIVAPVFATNSAVTIGDYAFISLDVYFVDRPAPVPPVDATFASAPDAAISIGDDVWIGARVVVLGGARIGNGVIVGAGSVVGGDIDDYCIVAGNPGRVVGSAPPRSDRWP